MGNRAATPEVLSDEYGETLWVSVDSCPTDHSAIEAFYAALEDWGAGQREWWGEIHPSEVTKRGLRPATEEELAELGDVAELDCEHDDPRSTGTYWMVRWS